MSVSRLTERRGASAGVALALFAAVLGLRFVAPESGDAVSFLYVIPVVLVAAAFGERGGLLAGLLALGLSVLWALLSGFDLSPLGYAVRAFVFLLIGDLSGRFAASLRAAEAESARHFELSLDMICIAGFDGRFKRVNPAFQRTLGYSEAELLARPFLDFVHPDDRERTEREVAALGTGDGTVQFQNRYLDARGDVRWIEWCSTALPDEEVLYAVARDVTDRKELERELERHAQQDVLTGLFNRRRFEQELERQLVYTRRYGSGGALLLVDLDRFKQINDELGHAAGDMALRAVAEILRASLRGSDTTGRGLPARLGGDEFVVLLPEAGEEGAQVVAERLIAALAEHELSFAGERIELSASIGIALFDADGCPPAIDLLAAADRAMYVAKAGGGSAAALR